MPRFSIEPAENRVAMSDPFGSGPVGSSPVGTSNIGTSNVGTSNVGSGVSARAAGASRDVPRQVEFVLLVGLAFTLPLLEAPKNILWALYVIVWIAGRVRMRDFGGPWDRWDTLFALWIGSAFAAAAFAGVRYSEWGGATDVLRYVSVLWLVRRTRFSANELAYLLGALVAGTAVTLLHGYWQYLGPRAKRYLELKSVGHVNHSAIYLAIVMGLVMSAVLSCWRGWSGWLRVGGLCALIAFIASLVIMESRGAIGVAALLMLALALAWARRSWRAMLVGGLLVIMSATTVWLVNPEALRKHDRNVQSDNTLAFRDQIWRMGIEAWRAHPWFGMGMDNFSRINIAMVKAWHVKRGEPFDEQRFIGSSHAHSLYVNTLAERGAIGLGTLLWVLLAWLYTLVRYIPNTASPNLTWVLWGSAFSAWFVTVGVGTVNTTLHHEHGLLAALCFGMWLSHIQHSR
jgi:O-antigen ligase